MSLEERLQSEDWYTLTDNENLVDVHHPSIWTAIPQIAFGIIFSIGSLLALIRFYGQVDEALYLGLGGIVLGLLMAAAAEFKRRHSWYVLTNEQVKRKEGIISVSVRQARYDDVQDISKKVELWERVLGYGNIHITTAGSATTEFVLQGVPNPNKMRETVVQFVDNATERTYVNEGTGVNEQYTQQQDEQSPANSQQMPQNDQTQQEMNGQPAANSQQTPQPPVEPSESEPEPEQEPESDADSEPDYENDGIQNSDMWGETPDDDADAYTDDDEDDGDGSDAVGVDPFDDGGLDDK